MFDGIIMAGVGVFIALVGFRKIEIVRSRPGFDAEAWHARHGRHMRIMGPFVVVAGITLSVWGWYA